MTKKVLLVIAHRDYQPIEYGITHEILTDAGVSVITSSDKSGTATATDGSTTFVDITLDNVIAKDYHSIFLIGGKGALAHLDTAQVHALLQEFKALDKPYGAICISPRILAKAEVLADKKATGWNGDSKLEDIFKQHEVTYLRQPIVVDGKAITAVGPEASDEFAQAILTTLPK